VLTLIKASLYHIHFKAPFEGALVLSYLCLLEIESSSSWPSSSYLCTQQDAPINFIYLINY
jgi:hypothetical protein